MAGSAKQQRIFKIINLDFVTDSDFAVIDRETGISSYHNYPGSVGLGFNYIVNEKITTYLSAEYFLPLDEYYVFKSDINPSSYPELTEPEIEHIFGEAPFISFTESSRQVLNLGIGLRWQFKENLSFLGGFRTDFNHNALGDYDFQRVVAEAINWDLYHLSFGLRKTGKKILTTGLEFMFSPKTKTRSFVNLSDPDEDNALIGGHVDASAQQFGLKFIVSYTIH